MERISASDPFPIRTFYLTNFYNHIGLPPIEKMLLMGDGLNIQYEHVTSEVVERLHQAGKLVFVWIEADVTVETVEVYCRMFDLNVDSFCTNYPLQVNQVWSRYKELKHT